MARPGWARQGEDTRHKGVATPPQPCRFQHVRNALEILHIKQEENKMNHNFIYITRKAKAMKISVQHSVVNTSYEVWLFDGSEPIYLLLAVPYHAQRVAGDRYGIGYNRDEARIKAHEALKEFKERLHKVVGGAK